MWCIRYQAFSLGICFDRPHVPGLEGSTQETHQYCKCWKGLRASLCWMQKGRNGQVPWGGRRWLVKLDSLKEDYLATRQFVGKFRQEMRTFHAERTADANTWRCEVGTVFREL